MMENALMDRIILENIPFDVDAQGFMEHLRIKPGSRNENVFLNTLDEALTLARPKSAFTVSQALLTGPDTVDIDGVTFTSRLLRTNLDHSPVVFPFTATCGSELEKWAKGKEGTLHSFWADSIMLMALGCALRHLEGYLKDRFGEGTRLSTMNPGSLEDWPLREQAVLFSLLGDTAQEIGVTLTEKMVLHPLKSLSGIMFLSEEGFVNCSLCPRSDCQGRRAAFDPDLHKRKFPLTPLLI